MNTSAGSLEGYDYTTRIFERVTTFKNEDDGTWLMADYDGCGKPDLVFIKTKNTTNGQVEVHIASGKSEYQDRIFERSTTFESKDADNGTWLMADFDGCGKPDLVFIKTKNTTNGLVEVHVASRKSEYKERILEGITTFASKDNGTWLMPDSDGNLVFLKTNNTISGYVQVYIASLVTCELLTKSKIEVVREGAAVVKVHKVTLVLNWGPSSCARELDWVGLWDHEPLNTNDYLNDYLTSDWVESHKDGAFVTGEQFDPSKTYWMAYCRRDPGSDRILSKQEFMCHPRWMTELGEKIEGKMLRELVLPASHDAATYGITASSDFSPDWPADERSEFRQSFAPEWLKAQVMDVRRQLRAGYRCFDLRVAKWKEDFWICHGMYSVKLFDVLNEIENFSRNNSQEIILLLIWQPDKRVTMTAKDYEELQARLKDTFKDLLAPYSSLGVDAEVQQFWNAGTPIVIFYDYDQADPALWKKSETLVTLYDETRFHSASSVRTYCEEVVIPNPNNDKMFWDLPLILTVDFCNTSDLIDKTLKGGLAAWTSESAVSEFVDFYQTQSAKLNLIAVDYINLYPLVRWAIRKNSETQQPKTLRAAQG